jgi:hypothetical protein
MSMPAEVWRRCRSASGRGSMNGEMDASSTVVVAITVLLTLDVVAIRIGRGPARREPRPRRHRSANN